MNMNEIEKIKIAGINSEAQVNIKLRLTVASLHLERESQEQFKNFRDEILEARILITNAEQLFEEIK